MPRAWFVLIPALGAIGALVTGCNDSSSGTAATATTSSSPFVTPSPSTPTDTATPTDSGTPAGSGTPAASPSEAGFHDAFDSNGAQWGEQAPDIQVQDGALVFTFKPDEVLTDAPNLLSSLADSMHNVVVTADVDFRDQQGIAGLTCESNTNTTTGYVLGLRTDGSASIGRYYKDDSGSLVEDGLSDDVDATAFRQDGVNTLTATCTQVDGHEHLELAVNGESVVTADDDKDPPAAGIPGVAAEAAPNPPNTSEFVVAFDNFTVSHLDS